MPKAGILQVSGNILQQVETSMFFWVVFMSDVSLEQRD